MPEYPEGATTEIWRHKTAIRRYSLSRPIRLAIAENLITSETEVLDYGCGHGSDVQQLNDSGISTRGWDPVFAPDGDRSPADVVNLGYVVNVIEDERERAEVLQAAWSRSKKVLIVAARLKQDMQSPAWLQFGDGCLTRSGTFQKYFDQSELREWIDTTLQTASLAAAPGVLWVFKDESERTAYVASRFRRQTKPPRIIDRFRGARETLAPLMDFVAEHGRLPDRRHREEVHRDHGLYVILEEGAPGLRWRLAMAHQILADAGFADVDAELEQFAVNARCSPQWILATQFANQCSDIFPNSAAAPVGRGGRSRSRTDESPCGAKR